MLVYADVAVCVYAVLDVLSQCIFGVVLLRKAPPVLSDWGEENMQQVCACSLSRRSSFCVCACLLVHLSSAMNPSSTCHDTSNPFRTQQLLHCPPFSVCALACLWLCVDAGKAQGFKDANCTGCTYVDHTYVDHDRRHASIRAAPLPVRPWETPTMSSS